MSSNHIIVNVILSKFNLIQSSRATVRLKRNGLSSRSKWFIAALSCLVFLVLVSGVYQVFSASKRIYLATRLAEDVVRPLKKLTPPPMNTIHLDNLFDVFVNNKTQIKDYTNFDASFLTSPRTSIFYPTRRSYEVGDTVEIRIDALDGMGRPQVAGGDFWFVKATSTTKNFRTAARLVDHANGSYSAYFLAPVVGRFDLQVILAYPSDSVRWLRDVYMKADGCFTWSAIYKRYGTVDGQGRCVVKRGLNQLVHKNLCFYGANETGMGESAFICTIPDGFICDDIRTIMCYEQSKGIEKPVNQLLVGKKYLFNSTFYKTPLNSPRSVYKVNVRDKNDTLPLIYDYVPGRPHLACGNGDSRQSGLLPEGYWLGDRWQSLICANQHWDNHGKVKNCLAGHKIIMFGDSIACQWFRVLQRMLDNKNVPDSYNFCAEDETHTVMYKRHVLSAVLSAPFNFYGVERVFEPEYMDSLNDPNLKYVIFISMSAHYASWNMDSYRDRMRAVRNGIARMRTRLGEDRVVAVVKKSQPREQPSFQARVHSNDYVFRQMSRIMEEEFVEIDAKMIDTWDMVLSYKKQEEVHMPWPCVKAEVELFLSHICQTSQNKSDVGAVTMD